MSPQHVTILETAPPELTAVKRDGARIGWRQLANCAGLMLLVGAGIARIADTYRTFNQTFDEPCHIACGMEWLDRGVYQYERQHPPLARVAVALGPYLDGLRSITDDYSEGGMVREGNAILYSRGTYWRNLTLARIGVLPFFAIASVLVWVWARSLFGTLSAWLATLLFTTLQPVLGHAGVATTDMAFTACFTWALYAFLAWWRCPGFAQTLGLGAALALAVLSKFTAFLFLPASMASALIVYRIAARSKARVSGPPSRERVRMLVMASSFAFLVVWAGYRFSFTPALRPGINNGAIERRLGTHGKLHDIATAAAKIPLPMGELIGGLGSLQGHASAGYTSYLLGSQTMQGWWYYFPLAFLVKTPLPLLFLLGVSLVLLIRRGLTESTWEQWAVLSSAAGIMLVCLPSPINIGIRHILPMYPLVAILAGFGAAGLLKLQKTIYSRILCILLLAWYLASSAASHPDYLAYFNEIAGQQPERFLVDSNLDWGQDLQRLSTKATELGIPEIHLSYFGTADPGRHGLPPIRPLLLYQPASGWVAISLFNLKAEALKIQRMAQTTSTYLNTGTNAPSPYAWLNRYQPIRVGKSIYLYYVTPGEEVRK